VIHSRPRIDKPSDMRHCDVRPRFVFLTLALLLVCASNTTRAQSHAQEYLVKAAFLYHFAQLVNWPPGSLDAGQPLSLCTIGDDPFQGELDRSVDGRTVGARVIRVRHLSDPKTLRACQIVFIGENEVKRTPTILVELAAAPVLTVGEGDSFAREGGMIGVALDDNKLRFDINLDPAAKSGLKISSKLLLLAKEVLGNRETR
jgi:hypothetical protein